MANCLLIPFDHKPIDVLTDIGKHRQAHVGGKALSKQSTIFGQEGALADSPRSPNVREFGKPGVQHSHASIALYINVQLHNSY